MQISNLIVPSKQTTVEYPGFPGFNVTLAFMTREELLKLRKRAATTKLNRKTRQMEEEVDPELFQQLYISSIVKGWSGLKVSYLQRLLPIDLPEGQDMDQEIEFSEENAAALMKNCADFDAWVAEVLDDVQNFTKKV